MIEYILDTDHISLFQRGHPSIRTRIAQLNPDSIAITIISGEELLRGRLAQVRKASQPEQRVQAYHWLQQTIEFLRDFTFAPYEPQAEAYFQALRREKVRVGRQDMKIGAIALSHNAIFVTRNRRDFEQIADLHIEDWS